MLYDAIFREPLLHIGHGKWLLVMSFGNDGKIVHVFEELFVVLYRQNYRSLFSFVVCYELLMELMHFIPPCTAKFLTDLIL